MSLQNITRKMERQDTQQYTVGNGTNSYQQKMNLIWENGGGKDRNQGHQQQNTTTHSHMELPGKKEEEH